MEDDHLRNTSGYATVGFCLLPSELLQSILLHLSMPEIIRMKLVNKFVFSAISDRNFIREFNSKSQKNTWLFVYARRWRRDAIIHGFSDSSRHWFKVPVAQLLKQVIFPDEDLYFLTASASFFLFASNTSYGIISVDLVSKTVKRLAPCPLGPRGTSSWRRSGMKLVADPAGSGYFRFMFAEMGSNNQYVLFIYDSETDTWQSKKGENNVPQDWTFQRNDYNYMFLNVLNKPCESIVMSIEHQREIHPVVLRPRFNQDMVGRHPLAIGFSRSDRDEQFHVYGDGHTIMIRLSNTIEPGIKKTKSIEVWRISMDGAKWEFVTRAPSEVIKKIDKPCRVMMGCVGRRLGMIIIVLMSNLEGSWNVVWLNYDKEGDKWEWIPLPHCSFFEGSNMAGITLSSGLTLS